MRTAASTIRDELRRYCRHRVSTNRGDRVPYTSPVRPRGSGQVPDIASVRGQRALDDAAVDAHPPEEPLDQSDGLAWGLDELDDAPLAEMLNESADTREDLSGATS